MARMIATKTPRLKTVASKPLGIVDRFQANCRRLMTDQNVSQVELTKRINEILGRTNPDSADKKQVPLTRPAVMQKINSDHAPSMEWIEIFARAFGEATEDMIQ